MSKNRLGRADQVGTTSGVSGEAHAYRGGLGQSDLPGDGGPATEGRTLQVKEEEDPTKEAFDGTALAQCVFGTGGGQAGTILLALGVPRDDGYGMQVDNTRMDWIETHGPFQERVSKGDIMHSGV